MTVLHNRRYGIRVGNQPGVGMITNMEFDKAFAFEGLNTKGGGGETMVTQTTWVAIIRYVFIG